MLKDFLTNKTKQGIVRVIFMLVMLCFMVFPVYKYTSESRIDCQEVQLDKNWNVKVHGTRYKNVTLSGFSFDMCNKGDTLTLESKLPKDKVVKRPVLYLYTVHSIVDIYLDEKKIYTYGHDLYDRGRLLGYGAHYISLPDNYAGKNIRIELEVTEDNAFDGIPMLSISESVKFVQEILAGQRINLAVALFLMLFGIITMVLSIFMLIKDNNFVQTFCIAMFSFLIGSWTLCNSDLITFFISDLQIKAYMEYMMFYVLPIPITYYFKGAIDEKATPLVFKIYFWLLLVIEVAYALTTYICQFFNIAHFPMFLSGCHIIMVFALIFVIGLNVSSLLRKEEGHSSIMIGFGIAGLAIALELLRYNIGKFVVGFTGNRYSSTLSFAVLILVIALLVDYGQSISRNLIKDAKQRLLEQLAYIDELTGLCNRRKCEDTLLEYNENNIPYAVISLDMNLLKKVNDSLGHDMGDKMLKMFSNLLLEVYDVYGTVGRMGGDEFIVILPEVSEKEAHGLIHEMELAMMKNNKSDNPIKLSAAYGLAMRAEAEADIEVDAHAVYRLADDRMYKNKRASKLGRRD